MLKLILRKVPKRIIRCRTYADLCYYNTDPMDPNCKTTYLENGVRMITEVKKSPLTCVSMLVAVGPRYESSNANGLTHMIEHLAYKGFIRQSQRELEDMVANIGGHLSVETMREMQIFSMLIPSKDYKVAFTTLSKIITEIDINDVALSHERYNICLEYSELENNPKALVFDHLHAAAFQGTPLAQPVGGPQRNVKAFNSCTVYNWFQENYTPCRIIVSTSGNVNREELEEHGKETFGKIKNRGDFTINTGPTRFTGSEVLYRNDDEPYCYGALAVEGPGYLHIDYWKMLVLSHMIGKWGRGQGRALFQTCYVAEVCAQRDMADYYEAFYLAYRDVGLWGVYFVGTRHELDKLLWCIQHAWKLASMSPYQKVLNRAIQAAKIEVRRRYDGVINSSRDCAIQMHYSCTRHALETALGRLDDINLDHIRDMGQKYLYDRNLVTVGIGPTEAIPPHTRVEGQMYWLRY